MNNMNVKLKNLSNLNVNTILDITNAVRRGLLDLADTTAVAVDNSLEVKELYRNQYLFEYEEDDDNSRIQRVISDLLRNAIREIRKQLTDEEIMTEHVFAAIVKNEDLYVLSVHAYYFVPTSLHIV